MKRHTSTRGEAGMNPLPYLRAALISEEVIQDFHCPDTERIWQGQSSRRFPPDIQDTARRKLRMLNNARNLTDLRIPPANRLEALKGGRAGQHSIRINDQWRICFRWQDGHACNVEIVDYH